MLQWIWLAMMTGAILYAWTGGGEILSLALEGIGQAIDLTIELGAGYMLFCGLMEIARALKVEQGIERMIRPVLRRLMPGAGGAREAVALNLSMNVLGLGNAATPMGMEAMRQMEQERALRPEVRHDMYMLLILNATSLQLLPTTVLALRAAAGAADIHAVVVPTVICTAVSTLTGALLGSVCRRLEETRRG